MAKHPYIAIQCVGNTNGHLEIEDAYGHECGWVEDGMGVKFMNDEFGFVMSFESFEKAYKAVKKARKQRDLRRKSSRARRKKLHGPKRHTNQKSNRK